MEYFANNAQSQLNAGITTSDTSLVVNPVTPFPFSTSGTFRILVDNEIMEVTGVNTSTHTFVVNRGYESTTITPHVAGTPVTQLLTSGALAQFKYDILHSTFGPSGGSHNVGTVPDPGSTTHTDPYLLGDNGDWIEITGSGVTYASNVYTIDAGGGFTNPMTTLGDMIYEDATPAPARLAGNTTTTNKFLTQVGTGTGSAVPAWSTIQATDLPTSAMQVATYTRSSGAVSGLGPQGQWVPVQINWNDSDVYVHTIGGTGVNVVAIAMPAGGVVTRQAWLVSAAWTYSGTPGGNPGFYTGYAATHGGAWAGYIGVDSATNETTTLAIDFVSTAGFCGNLTSPWDLLINVYIDNDEVYMNNLLTGQLQFWFEVSVLPTA